MGKELAVYRGEDGQVVALDAYCPHMGAHLGEGSVEGDEIRCLFHGWRFNSKGECTDIPCENSCAQVSRLKTWPVEEQYGLIWIWIGASPRHPIPFVPELGQGEFDYHLGKAFTKECHPNVVMINAIDEQHFASVHKLPVDLRMEAKEINESCILFTNTNPIPSRSFISRLIKRLYEDAGTYQLSYWYGTNGTVTLGPDILHFHILFALRPTEDGKTEGQTVLLTKRRAGLLGRMFSWVVLRLSSAASAYFAHGDTKIFRSIRFDLKTPIKADRSVIRFIQHLEKQKVADWGFGTRVSSGHEDVCQERVQESSAAVI